MSRKKQEINWSLEAHKQLDLWINGKLIKSNMWPIHEGSNTIPLGVLKNTMVKAYKQYALQHVPEKTIIIDGKEYPENKIIELLKKEEPND